MIPFRIEGVEPGSIRAPNDLVHKKLEDYEMGGRAIQDPSEGLQVQPWRLYMDGDNAMLDAPSLEAPALLFTQENITFVGLAFDQNMRWVITYLLDDGSCWLRWHDPVAAAYATTAMGMGVVSPHITHDDKRAPMVQSGLTDVILTYLKDNALIVRVQRERYATERVLVDDVGESTRIWHFGMNNKLRLQWELR